MNQYLQYLIVGVIILAAGAFAIIKSIKRLKDNKNACDDNGCCGCPLGNDCQTISNRYAAHKSSAKDEN